MPQPDPQPSRTDLQTATGIPHSDRGAHSDLSPGVVILASPTPIIASPSFDSSLSSQASPSSVSEAMGVPSTPDGIDTSSSSSPVAPQTGAQSPSISADVDQQILEALRSKDRIYVLKLGEQFEGLIKERRVRVEVIPTTSYQRLLVHRCSAYYKLQPESDPVTKALFVLSTPESRIPERRICELVPAESTMQPAFKIMKRSVLERRSRTQSHAGSVAGEDADLSDVEPSESGSLGGQSSITSSSTKKRMTIEQREAAYNEARSRIFMGFEEKEKGKEKDMSASSSSLSVGGSTSTSAGGRSSLGDTDDAASSPATESEWSTPSGSFSRDNKRDGRRGGSASASSSRSLRSGGSFHGNGSGSSSRNSRAASPSFTYATLYEPPPTGQVYDSSQHHNPNVAYHPNQYPYPYPPPNQGPNPQFMQPYPYYGQPYSYQTPLPSVPQHLASDPSSPAAPEPFSPPHPMNYGSPYGWPPHPNQPPIQSPPHNMHLSLPPPPPQQSGPHQMSLIQPAPPPHSPPYQPYNIHPPHHAYTYPMGAYYPPSAPPPGQQGPPQGPPLPPAHMTMQQQPHPGYDPRAMNGAGPMMHPQQPDAHFTNNNQQFNQANAINNHGMTSPRNALGNGIISPNSNSGRVMPGRGGVGVGVGGQGGSNVNVNNGNNLNNNNNGNGKRGGVPQQIQQMQQQQAFPPTNRSAWSYGPGISLGGFPASQGGPGSYVGSVGETVGPRFGNSNRRTSGHSSSGGNSRASSHSNGDDVSSIASSSTTSSSSRRTYTSTTSSQQQHPLPPRPDWAVGLKAQPTLASRHHDHSLSNSRTMSPISPSRSTGQNSPAYSGHSNSNDSPRQPGSSSSSLQATDFPPLTTAAGGSAQEKRAPVVSGAWGASRPMLSPPLNSSAPQSPAGEFFTPKGASRRPVAASPSANSGNQQPRTPPSGSVLVGHMGSMTLGGSEENGGFVDGSSSPSPAHAAPTSSTAA